MSVLIEAKGLTKKYGKFTALDKVNFEIESGRIIGLIGPNGAGKTTALKAILGLTSFSGDLKVMGMDPLKRRYELMHQVCFVADVAILPRWMRVWQAIDYVEGVHPQFSREKCEMFLSRTKIKRDSKVKQLSKGMIAQLHLALVMAIDAKLLVLDEPTLGLDIIYRKDFYTSLLNDYFDEQRTIIVTTHQVEEIEHILTDLMFINNGDIVLNTTMDAVQERFYEVMCAGDMADTARSLNPLYERSMFGKHVFLFDGVDADRLAELGELRTPSVADLFVATMKGAEE